VSSALSTTEVTGNLFLDNLPIAAFKALRPKLKAVSLQSGRVISERGEAIDTVIFPVSSILSVVLEMSDGDTAEVGIIGREGMSSQRAHRSFVGCKVLQADICAVVAIVA
jgi:CRP-like cAMP-binding protein